MNPECYEKVSAGVEQLDKINSFLQITGLVKQYGKTFRALD
jgi:hypothetical protein